MRELGSLLAKRETKVAVEFHHLNHRVRCFAHIINICSSHIISSMTSVSEGYLSELDVPVESKPTICDDLDEPDDCEPDVDDDIDELKLDDWYDDGDDPELKEWFAGIKRDPLRRARRIIRLLRSSDSRRDGFRDFIILGNEREWFYEKKNGKRSLVQVPVLQPLRDVKTRWDSVYMMVERLRQLRPVSSSFISGSQRASVIKYLLQAIDRYLDTDLSEFAHFKLSEYDWYVLEGLETVLSVSHLINPRTGAHIRTDSS